MEVAYYVLVIVKEHRSTSTKVVCKLGGTQTPTMQDETTGNVQHVDINIACRGSVGLVRSAVLVSLLYHFSFREGCQTGKKVVSIADSAYKITRCPVWTHSSRTFNGHIRTWIRCRPNYRLLFGAFLLWAILWLWEDYSLRCTSARGSIRLERAFHEGIRITGTYELLEDLGFVSGTTLLSK
jgi:hypothetical protein